MNVINRSDVNKRCSKLLSIIVKNPKMCNTYTMLCSQLKVNLTKRNKEVRYYIRPEETIKELMKIFDIIIYILEGGE